jgi:hypothetical protein
LENLFAIELCTELNSVISRLEFIFLAGKCHEKKEERARVGLSCLVSNLPARYVPSFSLLEELIERT